MTLIAFLVLCGRWYWPALLPKLWYCVLLRFCGAIGTTLRWTRLSQPRRFKSRPSSVVSPCQPAFACFSLASHLYPISYPFAASLMEWNFIGPGVTPLCANATSRAYSEQAVLCHSRRLQADTTPGDVAAELEGYIALRELEACCIFFTAWVVALTSPDFCLAGSHDVHYVVWPVHSAEACWCRRGVSSGTFPVALDICEAVAESSSSCTVNTTAIPQFVKRPMTVLPS